MRVVCIPNPTPLEMEDGIAFALLQRPQINGVGNVGVTLFENLRRMGIQPQPRAWDFLALSLSVIAADQGVLRKKSPDGWTREIYLEVAVTEPTFWQTQSSDIEDALRFLTGDIWRLTFLPGGVSPPSSSRQMNYSLLNADRVCLFSGGVDSLIGAINTIFDGGQPVLVSQVARGDAVRQRRLATSLGREITHLQLSHATKPPGKAESSQRARSVIFLAYGVLAATLLRKYHRGETIELLIPENGFISINVPLTPQRIGSLSTRTTHPYFIQKMQTVFDHAGLRVRLRNPYQFKTKGEMLEDCGDPPLLQRLVFDSTSCGRFTRFGYQHCGRCLPCLVRRAAFHHWGIPDQTPYRFNDLSIPDARHRDFDDVRSVAIAIHQVNTIGIEQWSVGALNYAQLGEIAPYIEVVNRGIAELRAFLEANGAL